LKILSGQTLKGSKDDNLYAVGSYLISPRERPNHILAALYRVIVRDGLPARDSHRAGGLREMKRFSLKVVESVAVPITQSTVKRGYIRRQENVDFEI
jgi:hypothetical protein